jgi:hypothetical protein
MSPRKQFLVGAIMGIFISAAMLALATLFCVSAFADGFQFPPQDCLLIGRDISGRVVNLKGNPIAGAQVTFQVEKDENRYQIVTDAQGKFEYNTLSAFACYRIDFEVAALGYTTKKFSFTAGQEPSTIGGDDTYGTISNPDVAGSSSAILPRQIHVIMS